MFIRMFIGNHALNFIPWLLLFSLIIEFSCRKPKQSDFNSIAELISRELNSSKFNNLIKIWCFHLLWILLKYSIHNWCWNSMNNENNSTLRCNLKDEKEYDKYAELMQAQSFPVCEKSNCYLLVIISNKLELKKKMCSSQEYFSSQFRELNSL